MDTALRFRKISIRKEPIELYKLLKMENMVQSGGEAKFVISEGLVSVNKVVETRKRKKIMSGDQVEFNGQRIEVTIQDDSFPETAA